MRGRLSGVALLFPCPGAFFLGLLLATNHGNGTANGRRCWGQIEHSPVTIDICVTWLARVARPYRALCPLALKPVHAGDGQSKPALGSQDCVVHRRSLHRHRDTVTNGLCSWIDGEERKRGRLAVHPRLANVCSRGAAWACRSCHYLARLRVGQTRGP
jgi:hypothetical protein